MAVLEQEFLRRLDIDKREERGGDYSSEDDKVYYHHPEKGTRELFITVHPTADSTLGIEEQAIVIARLLNGLAGKRGTP
jgi:hypothetical protein